MISSTLRQNWRALLLASALALVPGIAAAQTGTVRGTVSGPSGAAVSAATVTVVGTRFTTVTNTLGQFSLGGVPRGGAAARVAPRFAPHQRRDRASGRGDAGRGPAGGSNVELDAMVVSRLAPLRAPLRGAATVTALGAAQLAETPGKLLRGRA